MEIGTHREIAVGFVFGGDSANSLAVEGRRSYSYLRATIGSVREARSAGK